LTGNASEPGLSDQTLRRAVVEAIQERIVLLLSTVASKIMLGRSQPITFVRVVQVRKALVPQAGRVSPGLLPEFLQDRSLRAVERAQA
jgi:hypothetical protein